MNEDFRVGADIKFAADAYVIVIASETPSREHLIQKLGRGSRACGDYRGKLFVICAPSFKDAVVESIKKSKEPDFYYGAQWVKYVVRLHTSGENLDNALAGQMCKATKGVWRAKEADLVRNLIPKWAKEYTNMKKSIEVKVAKDQ